MRVERSVVSRLLKGDLLRTLGFLLGQWRQPKGFNLGRRVILIAFSNDIPGSTGNDAVEKNETQGKETKSLSYIHWYKP